MSEKPREPMTVMDVINELGTYHGAAEVHIDCQDCGESAVRGLSSITNDAGELFVYVENTRWPDRPQQSHMAREQLYALIAAVKKYVAAEMTLATLAELLAITAGIEASR